MIYIYHYQSPLGDMTIAKEDKNLIGVWFDEQKYFGSTLTKVYKKGTAQQFKDVIDWLDSYFNKQIPTKMPQLKLGDTSFRQDVWAILQTIPYGETKTYKDIARLLCQKRQLKTMSMQAIGGAISHNPISIIVPCHRVIGTKGHLTGYAGGIEKKEYLLRLERAWQS